MFPRTRPMQLSRGRIRGILAVLFSIAALACVLVPATGAKAQEQPREAQEVKKGLVILLEFPGQIPPVNLGRSAKRKKAGPLSLRLRPPVEACHERSGVFKGPNPHGVSGSHVPPLFPGGGASPRALLMDQVEAWLDR